MEPIFHTKKWLRFIRNYNFAFNSVACLKPFFYPENSIISKLLKMSGDKKKFGMQDTTKCIFLIFVSNPSAFHKRPFKQQPVLPVKSQIV